jgi:hypothetical protein
VDVFRSPSFSVTKHRALDESRIAAARACGRQVTGWPPVVMCEAGGFSLIDDLLARPNWPDGHQLGGVAVSVFLLPYVDNPLGLFFLAMPVCTVLEYVASFVMEKLFGTSSGTTATDRSTCRGGSACSTPCSGGFLGLLPIYVLDPATARLIESIPMPDVAKINILPPMSHIVEYIFCALRLSKGTVLRQAQHAF